jgi:hypothetical protein
MSAKAWNFLHLKKWDPTNPAQRRAREEAEAKERQRRATEALATAEYARSLERLADGGKRAVDDPLAFMYAVPAGTEDAAAQGGASERGGSAEGEDPVLAEFLRRFHEPEGVTAPPEAPLPAPGRAEGTREGGGSVEGGAAGRADALRAGEPRAAAEARVGGVLSGAAREEERRGTREEEERVAMVQFLAGAPQEDEVEDATVALEQELMDEGNMAVRGRILRERSTSRLLALARRLVRFRDGALLQQVPPTALEQLEAALRSARHRSRERALREGGEGDAGGPHAGDKRAREDGGRGEAAEKKRKRDKKERKETKERKERRKREKGEEERSSGEESG